MSLCVAWFGLTFQTIGMILNIVGVATSNWLVWKVDKEDNNTSMEAGLYRVGLFKFCSDALGECKDFPHSLDHYHDIIESSQAATLVGLGLGILSVLVSLWVLVLVSRDKDRKAPRVLGVLLFILSPLFTAGGATIFFMKMLDAYDNWDAFDMGYSAYTCFIGAILLLIFGSITICGTGKSSKASPSNDPNTKPQTETPSNNGIPPPPPSPPNNPNTPMAPQQQQQQQQPSNGHQMSGPPPQFHEGTPMTRTQSVNDGRGINRAQSVEGNNHYPTMPAQYGATQYFD